MSTEVQQLRVYLRDPAHKVSGADSTGRHREALPDIWQYASQLVSMPDPASPASADVAVFTPQEPIIPDLAQPPPPTDYTDVAGGPDPAHSCVPNAPEP